MVEKEKEIYYAAMYNLVYTKIRIKRREKAMQHLAVTLAHAKHSKILEMIYRIVFESEVAYFNFKCSLSYIIEQLNQVAALFCVKCITATILKVRVDVISENRFCQSTCIYLKCNPGPI